MRRIFTLILLPFLLNGCVAALVAEAGTSVAENRSFGRKVDDKVLYGDVYGQFLQAEKSYLIQDVNINTRFGRVMLTGKVHNEEDAQLAVSLAWKARGVEEVINELVIEERQSFWNAANDSLIKRNLESRLLMTKQVWVINYSFDIQNGVAYIIGRVKDQGELDRVLSVARTTRGIKRVVSHLQINTDTDRPTPPPASGKAQAPVQQAPVPVVHSGPVSQESTIPADDVISSQPLDTPR